MQLPEAFQNRMRETLGYSFQRFADALKEPVPTSIRVNPTKNHSRICGDAVPWTQFGIYLDERPVFTLDPHLHAGAYYVQEASSMFLEHALKTSVDLSKSIRVLDLSAAPGGKSTHILSLISNESLLVSNEVIRTRASILSENIQKWGYANAIVTNNDPKDFQNLEGYFDVIVVDAPCSGEGLFRKDEDAMKEWSEDHVNLCSLRQRRIVTDVWPALKQNGVLIYCTCTYNEAENEGNLDWLSQQKEVEFIPLPNNFTGVTEVLKGNSIGYRFMPHLTKGEGFFISALRKKSSESETNVRRQNTLKASKLTPGWLIGDFEHYEMNELLIAVPKAVADDINFLSKHLSVVTRGVAVATIARNKLIPEHALALCKDINASEVATMDVDKQTALKYLAKETINPATSERGFAIVTFEGSRLGFVNQLGNRINNLYPSNWRIRMKV